MLGTLVAVVALCGVVSVAVYHLTGAIGTQLAASKQLNSQHAAMNERLLVQRSAGVLAAKATADEDGWPRGLQALPAAFAPFGGGGVPVAIGAPQGGTRPFGYCAWDNGQTTTQGYISGSIDAAAPAISVVSPGADGVFQTSCSQAGAGNAQGDDYVVTYVVSQLANPANLNK